MDDVVMRPIGVIRTPFRRGGDPPRRPGGPDRGRVEVFPRYRAGLKDMDGFSHVVLVFHFDRSDAGSLTARPPGDGRPRGVFATRSPSRPNPVGVSTVRLVAVEDGALVVEGVDMLDMTPLLDIKPYIPYVTGDVRLGWLEASPHRPVQAKGGPEHTDDRGGRPGGRSAAAIEGVTVREFTMDDYDEAMALWERCDAERRPLGRDGREAVRRQMGLGTAIYLVAVEEGRIVGTAFATHDGRRGWINRLVVDVDRRRRGVGSLLVGEAERRLDARGIDIVAVHVWETNSASIATFSSLGYETVPDCIYMSKRKGPDV